MVVSRPPPRKTRLDHSGGLPFFLLYYTGLATLLVGQWYTIWELLTAVRVSLLIVSSRRGSSLYNGWGEQLEIWGIWRNTGKEGEEIDDLGSFYSWGLVFPVFYLLLAGSSLLVTALGWDWDWDDWGWSIVFHMHAYHACVGLAEGKRVLDHTELGVGRVHGAHA